MKIVTFTVKTVANRSFGSMTANDDITARPINRCGRTRHDTIPLVRYLFYVGFSKPAYA